MNTILLEEKYILEYIRDIIQSSKTGQITVNKARYHHNTKYCDAPSVCHHGILTMSDLKNIGIKDYNEDFFQRMDDIESHINGIGAVSLSVVGLHDLYDGEEEYNPFTPDQVDFLVSSEIKAGRSAIHYGNEFLSQKSISVDKLRSIDIRLLKLIEMIESGYSSDSYIIQNAIEKYNYLREVALVMKSNQLDIPLREMSHHQNYSLDINKLSSNPKLVLKQRKNINI